MCAEHTAISSVVHLPPLFNSIVAISSFRPGSVAGSSPGLRSELGSGLDHDSRLTGFRLQGARELELQESQLDHQCYHRSQLVIHILRSITEVQLAVNPKFQMRINKNQGSAGAGFFFHEKPIQHSYLCT
jgi:hypothetical protein